MEKIIKILYPILANALGIEESEITLDFKFKKSGMDSMRVMNSVVEIEKRFEINISEEELLKIEDVENLISLIKEKEGKKI